MKITKLSQLSLAVAITISNTFSLSVESVSAKVLNGQASQSRIQRKESTQLTPQTGLISGDAMSAFSASASTSVAKPTQLIDAGVFTTVPKAKPLTSGITASAGLTREDVEGLHKNDIAILIDTSSSMKEKVLPDNVSRWDWCRNQLLGFTQKTTANSIKGIDVLLFNSDLKIFPEVDLNTVKTVFANNYPAGGTKLDPALNAVFTAHFKRKSEGSTKKLKVIIISDCLPPVGFIPIGTAASQVGGPNEISVTFLNVVSLTAFTSVFSATTNPNIPVEVRPFEIVNKAGLSQTILEIIKRNH
ncbi:hypothetical protein KA183_04710 [bacterium]|nr:hypothetical protein [bacterium]QQR56142.1 MAG: hypothetical protein IPG59_14130 [Candidatus Melainabacteria bacterium]